MSIDERFGVSAGGAQLDRAAEALRANGYTVHVMDSAAEARKLVAALVPRDQSVFTASSETLRLSGIAADLDESGDFQSVRAKAGDLSGDVYDQIRLGALPDIVVGSVHAVTEEGHLVVGSATGSQFAPYASGARKAVWVVGAQKVVPDLETALSRIRSYSLPKEHQRIHDLSGQSSFLGRILILEREAFPDRGTVVLVRETIGF
ncbi:LUD domain-containing protein [Rugosimonospora africana]|uniref:LUD domain-containing protein n=1 Tax=Rugosimonospora africana TaxID=556532 RepID=UPI00194363BE|nr:LUD domain-containing protein [Rugosimonospora africana]